jgi:hypothetical protein
MGEDSETRGLRGIAPEASFIMLQGFHAPGKDPRAKALCKMLDIMLWIFQRVLRKIHGMPS